MQLNNVVAVLVGILFFMAGNLVNAQQIEEVTIPDHDWREGRPSHKQKKANSEDYAEDFFQPVPEDQQNLNDSAPPEPPDTLEDEYGPARRNAPLPPPGYENLTLPGEPPRR